MAWQPKCGPAPFCHALSHISEEPLLYLMFICPLALPPWWSSKNIMWHIMPWICAYITLCLYIWIYNLSNITCHHHNFCVRNRSRLHIMHVWHPRQRAGIAIACPVDSLAHRATASCTPIVHPPSWQPGPSGNRQLHAHWAPAQLTAWPIGQPPAERPLCTRPAASLAHRATASWTPIVHPPSCQPVPSGNRQLHDHSAPPAASLAHRATASCTTIVHPQLPAWPIGQPPAARPAHTHCATTQLHRELSRSPWAAPQCTRQHPPPQSPRTYDLSAPFPPTSQMKTKPGCQCLNVCLINCELLLIVGMISV